MTQNNEKEPTGTPATVPTCTVPSGALVLLGYLLAVINDQTEEITTTTNGQDLLVVANTKELTLLFNQADCEALKTVGGDFAKRILDQLEKGGEQ